MSWRKINEMRQVSNRLNLSDLREIDHRGSMGQTILLRPLTIDGLGPKQLCLMACLGAGGWRNSKGILAPPILFGILTPKQALRVPPRSTPNYSLLRASPGKQVPKS